MKTSVSRCLKVGRVLDPGRIPRSQPGLPDPERVLQPLVRYKAKKVTLRNARTFMRLGPVAATVSTLKSRTAVPFQTPTVPFCTTISEAKMKPQSRDSYQPRESDVHSKRWVRGGLGSRPGGKYLGGEGDARSVRMVCNGRIGSQESIQWAVGSKPEVDGEMLGA